MQDLALQVVPCLATRDLIMWQQDCVPQEKGTKVGMADRA